jgi:predicted transcriptional regulator
VPPKLTRLELQIMDALWTLGSGSVREIQEALPAGDRPAYTTVQTIVSRLEAKKAVRRVKKVGNAYIFEAQISRTTAQRRLIDDLLSFFGGRTQPVVAHLIDAGKLTLEDVQEAERTLRRLARKDRP